MEKAFGRTLNTNTMMYEFSDGSGVSLPAELISRIKDDFSNPTGGTITGLQRKWNYEENMKHSQEKPLEDTE